VRQIGTPREVYDEPADTFVATFLGSPPMNLLEDGNVAVGFRPETLAPAAAVISPSVKFRIRITNLEYLGSESIVYGVLEGGRFAGRKVVSRIPTSTPGILRADEVQEFAVARKELKFFDKATTKRTAPVELQWA
jgi:multiple sugar transport system ATP-binding protein